MKKRHVNILLGVVAAVVLCVGVLLVGGVWFAMHVFHREDADERTATARLEEVRRQFRGATPVFEIRSNGPTLTRPVPATDPATQLRTLHFMVWDPDDESLTQADVPLALLRLRDSPVDVFQFANDVDRRYPAGQRVSIRLSELDRFGSALLVDQQMEDGNRVLAWTD